MKRGRLATFDIKGETRFGAVTEKGVVDLTERVTDVRDLRAAVEQGALRRLVDLGERHAADYTLDDVVLRPPIQNPEKIICVGVNYPDRNAEYKDGQEAPPYPSLFPRFARSFTGHRQPMVRPKASDKFDYEGEVAVIVGKSGRHIAENDAWTHIAAASLANEGTLRDWVRHAKFNVTQGKNFDSSGALGPWITPFSDVAQLADIKLTTKVNGELRQDDRTSRMIFSIPYLISYISTFTTLAPGDVILTGTPTGAGARFDPPRYLKPGDVIEIEAEGLGALVNTVADEV